MRKSVASFLNSHGTTNETLILIRLLKDPEDAVVQTAAKALARLQDERGIVPLTEVLAGGIRMEQFNQSQNLQFLPDIAAALQSFGPVAEEDVAALLDERGIEFRRAQVGEDAHPAAQPEQSRFAAQRAAEVIPLGAADRSEQDGQP